VITIADPLDLDALRIRHEFLSLPDLRVSVATAAAIFGVSAPHARRILDSLAAERFLTPTTDDQYVRNAATS
jgi:hypothetical protein